MSSAHLTVRYTMPRATKQLRASSRPAPRAKSLPVPRALAPEPPGAITDFIDRDLSWLEFNARVLHEAIDDRTPLLDRLSFLGIFTTNLDEFVMKRVGMTRHLLSQRAAGADSQAMAAHLLAIKLKILPMLERQARCFTEQILPALAANGIHLLSWDQITASEREIATKYFESSVFPVLTPQAVDLGHPFPFLSNLSMSLAIELRQPETGEKLFARVKVPKLLAQWVRVSPGSTGGPWRFIGMHELVRQHLGLLFRGMEVVDVVALRVTRSAFVLENSDTGGATDLLEIVEQQVKQRRLQDVIRLEHGRTPNRWLLDRVIEQLGLSVDQVFEAPGEIDFTRFREITDLPLPALRSAPWTPTIPSALAGDKSDLFAQIRAGDLLIHHPYESFDGTVARFIRDAVDDEAVLCIKMTVYRTSDDSPFMPLLIRAAERGKQVVCLVELKARFDEDRNIHWAEALEDAGVHVVYGLPGLKTHCKTSLVIRREDGGVRCYAHIGTGNYNPQTARVYEDLGLFTANPSITSEIVELFHYLTGRSIKRDYAKILVAPVNLKAQLLALLDAEVAAAQAGRPAQVVAKLNQLEDKDVCRALQRASQAGVDIVLIVRGLCVLRPGVVGLSEKIRVYSLVGRFLEHSRIYYFRAGAATAVEGTFYIGSADWMHRNLEDRVEVVAPIEDRALKERCWAHLETILADHRQVWEMQSDGSYVQRQPPADATPEQATGTHKRLMQLALSRNEVYQAKRR